MAEAYRESLTKKQEFEEKPAELYVDFVGAITRKKSIMGFPAEPKMELTSFDDALNIAKSISDFGADTLNLRYLSWDQKTLDKKIVSKASPSSILGGSKGFNQLLEFTKSNNIGFYPDVDLLYFTKTDYPFAEYFDAARNMNNQIGKLYDYKRNLLNKDTERGFSYAVNADKLQKSAASFLTSYEKMGTQGLSLSSLGNTVVSSYKKGGVSVEGWKSAEINAKIITDAAAKNSLLLDSPFLPLALSAKHIVNLPGSSDYDMTDYAVPFYQMVISGLVSYSGKAVNLAADTESAFLTALETGSGLHYTLLANSDSELIKDTRYDYLIGANASEWLPTIEAQYNRLREASVKLGGRLVSYEVLQNGVVKSGYSGGGSVIINKTSMTVSVDGKEIAPKGYLFMQGGEYID